MSKSTPMGTSSKYQNLDRITIISLGFFFLFVAFNSAANLSAQIMNNDGFEGLGFYTMAMLYLIFAFCSFLSAAIVNKIGTKVSLVTGGLCYFFWVFCFLAPAFKNENPHSTSFIFNKNFITFISLFSAAINGFGAGILWVAQGQYLSDCASDANKGFFFSYFWAFFMSSQILGNLTAALILGNLPQSTYYIIIFKEDIILTFQMLVSRRMMFVLPLITWSAVSQSIYSGCFVPMMNTTMADQYPDWDSNKKLEYSLLAMIPLGLGSVIGGLIQGQVADKFGQRLGVIYIMIVSACAFAVVFAFVGTWKFGVLTFFMTFIWGIQDSGMNNYMSCTLGFQFDSKIIPFSILKFVQSLFTFIFLVVESLLTFQVDYIIYLIVMACVCFASLTVMLFFPYKSVEKPGLDSSERINQKNKDSALTDEE
eukprot:403358919